MPVNNTQNKFNFVEPLQRHQIQWEMSEGLAERNAARGGYMSTERGDHLELRKSA